MGEQKARAASRLPKKKIEKGTLHVIATYNNTILTLTDSSGNTLSWASSGSLGFSGAKRGTPFAAAKVGELVGEHALLVGMKDVHVIIKGIGAGRESSLRAFSNRGINISRIEDATPVPHNGPRPPKPRRV